MDSLPGSPPPFLDENWRIEGRATRKDVRSTVHQWQQLNRETTPLAELPLDAPSPVPSDWSDASIETVMGADGAMSGDAPVKGFYNIEPVYRESTYKSIYEFEYGT